MEQDRDLVLIFPILWASFLEIIDELVTHFPPPRSWYSIHTPSPCTYWLVSRFCPLGSHSALQPILYLGNYIFYIQYLSFKTINSCFIFAMSYLGLRFLFISVSRSPPSTMGCSLCGYCTIVLVFLNCPIIFALGSIFGYLRTLTISASEV